MAWEQSLEAFAFRRGSSHKIHTAQEVPSSEDIYSRRYEESLALAEQERAQALLITVTPPQPKAVTPEERQLDLLLRLTLYANLTEAKTELAKCSEGFRNEVFGQVYNLSPNRDSADPKWGENHAFDNPEILRRALHFASIINPAIL